MGIVRDGDWNTAFRGYRLSQEPSADSPARRDNALV